MKRLYAMLSPPNRNLFLLFSRPAGDVRLCGHLSVGKGQAKAGGFGRLLALFYLLLLSNMTTFQPRPGDACTWLAEDAFYDFDDELEEQDLVVSLHDLQTGYEIMHTAFTEANISFAAIGGFVFSILGGMEEEDLTHDVTFQINSTPVELFTKLRTMKKYVLFPLYRSN